MAKRFEKHQIDGLRTAFKESEHLTKEKKLDLVRVTGLDVEQITSWFNRERARKRARQARQSIGDLERLIADLKESLIESQERGAQLQKELQESQRREAEFENENRNLKRRLAIAEGDSHFDPLIRFINGYP